MSRSNFAEELKQLSKAENWITEGDIQIWGGIIEEDNLQQFIRKWGQSDMPFAISETVNKMAVKNCDVSTLKIEPYTDRIRVFGESGDLDIRRDNNYFKWRYVGTNRLPKDLKVDKENFWEKNKSEKFFMEEKEALLWGTYKQDEESWQDNRVAKAKLSYPVEGHPGKGVKIRYKTLSNCGIIVFTWLLTIEEGD